LAGHGTGRAARSTANNPLSGQVAREQHHYRADKHRVEGLFEISPFFTREGVKEEVAQALIFVTLECKGRHRKVQTEKFENGAIKSFGPKGRDYCGNLDMQRFNFGEIEPNTTGTTANQGRSPFLRTNEKPVIHDI